MVMKMITNLISDGPDPELKNKLSLFGQFIGNWKIESIWYLQNGLIVNGSGMVSFGWILYGTCIQDVWTGEAINPPKNFPKRGFGTTLRFYNQQLESWNCIWIAPVSGVTMIFTARQKGNEILLEGKKKEGSLENWIYSNIKADSFDWRAEISFNQGKTWIIEQKIKGTRLI